ncbi:MAG: FKBP-type peptidyl-prolyl cis-trans isomerase [Edaphobacter sp.]
MIFKLPSIALLATLSTAATAQTTPTKPATNVHRPATTTPATAQPAAPCAKHPELSPKIPALPAGLPCAKPLYTLTIGPNVKLDYVSPLAGPELSQTLGIESTTFSLDYIDTKIGTGELAAPHKWYMIHYTGYLTDGTKFDSSVDRGEPLPVAYGQHQVIPGWDTGFDGMRVGGKRRLFIPYQLAYGANGKPGPAGKQGIPPKAELIFDVELISQSDEKPAPKTPPAPATTPAPAPAGTTQPPATPPADSTAPHPAQPQPATSPNPNTK